MRAVCPECRGKFPWEVSLGYPKSCPLCGFSIGHDRADDDIVMPFIRSAKTKANDALYRQMEDASEVRAAQAAEMAGVPVSEMSALKMTNMQDARREGDIAAPPVTAANNSVLAHMEATNQGGFQGGNAVEYSGAVQTGPEPNAGARMRTQLQQHHATATGYAAVSDMPAKETTEPGYRRRG